MMNLWDILPFLIGICNPKVDTTRKFEDLNTDGVTFKCLFYKLGDSSDAKEKESLTVLESS